MDEHRFTILLDEDVPVDPRKYGELVAPALQGLSRLEVKIAVRRGRGVFLENIEEEHALRIAAELARDGIRAHVLPVERLPVLPVQRKVTHLDHGEDLLGYTLPGTEQKEALPWEAVLLASIGVVAKPEYQDLFGHVQFHMVPAIHQMEGRERDLVRENLMLKMGSTPPSTELSRKRRPDSIFETVEQKYGRKVKVYADLITADLGTWLRVPMDEIGYVYLAGGVRMGGCWGFQMLVNDLRDKCPAAFPGMTLKLLEAADIKDLVFPLIEEFNRYAAWSVYKRILWPSADSSSPSPAPPGSSTDAGSSSASPPPEPPSTSP